MANDPPSSTDKQATAQLTTKYGKPLLTKRANIVKKINYHADRAIATPKPSESEALNRLSYIEPAYDSFIELMKEFEELSDFDEDDMKPATNEIVETFIQTASKLKSAIKGTTAPDLSLNSSVMQNRSHQNVKLPRISIPTFNGNYNEWTTFYDAFISLVDSNPDEPDVSKMHHLRSCLSGTAFSLIKTLPVTETNYKRAWKLLCDRFHNKRAIVNACLAAFINQTPLKQASAATLRRLIDTSRESLQTIDSLGVLVEEWDPIVIYIMQTKLDRDTLKEWELYVGGSVEIPKCSKMMDFLETQWRIWDITNENVAAASSAPSRVIAAVNMNNRKRDVCTLCKNDHWLFFCPTFDSYSVQQRKKLVLENCLCINCLRGHKVSECRSKRVCKKCGEKHNTKLHEDETVSINHITTNEQTFSAKNGKLLATAVVKTEDKFGIKHLLRAFIDMGSEGAVISEKAAQLLSLPRNRVNVPLTGIDEISLGKATSSVRLQVESALSEFSFQVDALVKKNIIKKLQRDPKMMNEWKHLDNLQLADPQYLSDEPIDLLFGIDIYAAIVKSGVIKNEPHQPIAQNSEFGWLVFGTMADEQSAKIQISHISLSNQLEKFWINEEVAIERTLTEEEAKCVAHFSQNVTQNKDGQIVVALPFSENTNSPNFLGSSEYLARKRWEQTEKRCKRDLKYRERYNAEMQSYIDLGHMTPCDDYRDGYFIPHHAVIRENSTTTKQRTVYDASAKTTNGFSLNDRLLNGPTIQPELFDTFIRWRKHKIALVADVEKMYRQILVRPEDRKYQKILFRFSENEPLQAYQLNTVTFGMKSSPYLAIASTFHLAEKHQTEFSNASKRIKTDMYVDDCMSGESDTQSAQQLQKELNLIFESARMSLRKWASNDEAALIGVAPENRAIDTSLQLNKTEVIKTLGMSWTPNSDHIHFRVDMSDLSHDHIITKRKLLSDASKLYDPCGLLSPITIKAKLMMQELWKSGIKWDESVCKSIQAEWNQYKQELPLIESIYLDRWFKCSPTSSVSLHGFCDASEKAFAAVIFLVQNTNGCITTTLICAKTRVAPIKTETIPRLELCGAVLVSRLANRVMNNLEISKQNVFLWTDSSIVLTWLQSHASQWKTYIAHRVGEIQSLFDRSHWQHVRTHDNPADIASRGCLPNQLLNNQLWFCGPNWLTLSKDRWPKLCVILPPNEDLESKPSEIQINLITKPTPKFSLITRYSSLIRLLRATAHLIRFFRYLRNKKLVHELSKIITPAELQYAKIALIRHVQQEYFAQEVSQLKNNEMISKKSPLISLNPQLNAHGVMIVNGRLGHANLPESQRFPMILPAKSHLSTLFVDHAHQSTLHGTIHLTLACVRQEVWIINGRNAVKSWIHSCIPCFRQKPKPMEQLMAPLPAIKTTPARAFLHCGLDFAGPIEIKSSERRNASAIKSYICVFVCMASKAIHLELVGDLSTAKFILAVRRMMSRRGIPSNIYCDQGTNFQGASNELPRLFAQATSATSQEIAKLFANDGITFHFNPPHAPNWGGQWESFVKLTKHHLRRMTSSIKFTFEEMTTLLAQIESCINSRPLCALTSDINDLDPLTAGHLLIGAPLNLIPEPNLDALKENALDRFQAIQKGVQTFWKRFSIEYLHNFHPRTKWNQVQTNLAIGDLVIIIDDSMPLTKWRMARVLNIHPSADGLVRLATVKTSSSTMQRPIAKLCRLPSGIPPPEDVPDRT